MEYSSHLYAHYRMHLVVSLHARDNQSILKQKGQDGPLGLFLAFPGYGDLSLAIDDPDMVRQFIRLEHVAFSPFFRSLQMLVQGLDGMLSIHKGADHSRWLSPMLQMNGLASAPRLASLKSQFLP